MRATVLPPRKHLVVPPDVDELRVDLRKERIIRITGLDGEGTWCLKVTRRGTIVTV